MRYSRTSDNLDKYNDLNELDYESRESTREQFYEELQKIKANLRKQTHDLRCAIEIKKESILMKGLGKLFDKLKELNQVNQQLREKHQSIYCTKKSAIISVTAVASSTLQTPRSRKNTTRFFPEQQNSFCKTKLDMDGRKSLRNQNQKQQQFGRMSLKMPVFSNKNMDKMTQKKLCSSIGRSNGCNLDISVFSEVQSARSSGRNSFYGKNILQPEQNKNIFVNFIEIMLEEQKQKQSSYISIATKLYHRGHEEIFVNNLQTQIQKTTQNIQKLQGVLALYEKQIAGMQINLESVTDMTKQLQKVKQNYIIMQKKCNNIQSLRLEVKKKQRRLQQLKQTSTIDNFRPPASVQMILRLFGVQQANINDPIQCKKQIKSLVKGGFERPTKRKLKIKELFDTIRQGRKKFTQLMAVYEGRVKKLQKKLAQARLQQTKRQQNRRDREKELNQCQ